jgi:SNF2 family DNA or RNA helicase
MKTLFKKQQEAADFFLRCLRNGVNTLDSSDVGTGKTVVAAYIARTLKGPVAVICPKAVIPAWERELAEMGVTPLFVVNYEKIRTGKMEYMAKRGKKIFLWNLPDNTLVLCDEAHKMKGPYTLNSQLAISLVNQGHQLHMMSATAAEDPTEMRALGYALDLHSLNKTEGAKKNWYSWMLQFGCAQDLWNQWQLKKRSKLLELHDIMYANNCKRLTVHDFPDSFRANRVFIEPIQFQDQRKILNAYKEAGITPAIVTKFFESSNVEDSEFEMVNLLRARQLAESFKVKDMADMAKELVNQHKSVVLFVNFSDTVDTLCGILKCKCIRGGQQAQDRQDIIDAFQRDEEHVLVVNTAAGGTGISLHDVNGARQRVTLISPSFNVKDYMQALGRIHRNGAKSDAIQKILVASDTVEEKVIEAIEKKVANIRALH